MNYDKVVLKSNLKQILKEQNISVNKLSADIQERRSTINDLVNNVNMNNRRIPASLLAKLKIHLGVSFDEMFEVEIKKDEKGNS